MPCVPRSPAAGMQLLLLLRHCPQGEPLVSCRFGSSASCPALPGSAAPDCCCCCCDWRCCCQAPASCLMASNAGRGKASGSRLSKREGQGGMLQLEVVRQHCPAAGALAAGPR